MSFLSPITTGKILTAHCLSPLALFLSHISILSFKVFPCGPSRLNLAVAVIFIAPLPESPPEKQHKNASLKLVESGRTSSRVVGQKLNKPPSTNDDAASENE